MKKAIVSFGTNYHHKLLSLSVPTFYIYAHTHNYDLFLPNEQFFNDDTKKLPPSWWKLDAIAHLLSSYDKVLWLDADVIIYKFDVDIIDTVDDRYSDFSVVVHETLDGQVPNCGVWLLNKSCLSWLDQLKQYTEFRRSQFWWEQAALLHLLGINPDDQVISLPTTYNIPWTQLDYIWNPHVHDKRKIPEETRFFHATSYNDRYGIMKNLLNQINI